MSLWHTMLGKAGVGGREEHPYDLAPCSSCTVNKVVNIGAEGAIWSLCFSPHEARQLGLTGIDRAGFLAKSVANCSFQCAMVGGIATASHCGMQKYRGKDDWVNCLVSGATAGGVFAALSRSWKQFIPATCLITACKIAPTIIKEPRTVNTS